MDGESSAGGGVAAAGKKVEKRAKRKREKHTEKLRAQQADVAGAASERSEP